MTDKSCYITDTLSRVRSNVVFTAVTEARL